MATAAPITGAPTRARSNVVPFPARRPDTPTFDPSNPFHVAAWEALFAFGKVEMNRQREGRA